MKAMMRVATIVIGLGTILGLTIPASAAVRSPRNCSTEVVGSSLIIEECSFKVALTYIWSSTLTGHFETWNRQIPSQLRNDPKDKSWSRDQDELAGAGWNQTCAEFWQKSGSGYVRLGSIVCTTN